VLMRAASKDKPQHLTLVQRHDIAVKETEQLNGDLKELEKRTQREVDSLKVRDAIVTPCVYVARCDPAVVVYR
jgi:hypothetical protein